MANTTDAKNKLASQRGAKTTQGDPSVAGLVAQMTPQIERALPKAMSADRFTRMVLTTLRTNPKLAQCDGGSLLAACMLSAQLGLEPGPLGHAYYVPYKNQVTFILGYRGMLELARRSGEITSIEAREVREHDKFTVVYGLEPKLEHEPSMGERGEPTHYYGIAKFTDGGHYFEVMSKEDIDGYRNRSMAKDNGPWVTDYGAMARKTVIRRMAPYLPLSAEAERAVASDEGVVASLADLSDHDTEVGVSHDEPIDVDPVQDDVVDAEEVEPDGEDIDSLRKPQLVKRLHDAGLDEKGKVEELRERWRAHVEGTDQGGGDDEEPVSPADDPSEDGEPLPPEPEDTQDQDRDEAGEPDPSDSDGSPESDSPDPDEGPDAAPEVEPERASASGDGEPWQEHANRLGVKVVPLLNAFREQWGGLGIGNHDSTIKPPTRSADIEALAQSHPEVVHQVIESVGGGA